MGLSPNRIQQNNMRFRFPLDPRTSTNPLGFPSQPQRGCGNPPAQKSGPHPRPGAPVSMEKEEKNGVILMGPSEKDKKHREGLAEQGPGPKTRATPQHPHHSPSQSRFFRGAEDLPSHRTLPGTGSKRLQRSHVFGICSTDTKRKPTRYQCEWKISLEHWKDTS